MKTVLTALALLFLTATAAFAQKGFGDDLIAHLAGDWTLTGTIAGHEVTHDIEAAWVLGGYYLQIHEVSQGKTPEGAPQYEAIDNVQGDESRSFARVVLKRK